VYCCAIEDLFSNRIVDYLIDDRMTARLRLVMDGGRSRRSPVRERRRRNPSPS